MTTRTRRFLFVGAIILGVLLIFTGIGVEFYIRSLGPRARVRLIAKLSDRFDADVQLEGLSLNLLPNPRVEGTGLTIRHKGWTTPSPLISIRKFIGDTDITDLIFERDEVDLVRLEGLMIDIPPKGRSASGVAGSDSDKPAAYDKSNLRVVINTLIADGAVIRIEPKTPDKDPLIFSIHNLTMHSVGAGQPMTFQTKLENATPPGLIDSAGRFGPWQKEEPGNTPVSGTYTFSNADLGVFKGISGTLASSGNYSGVLSNINVQGQTDTPDFALKRGGAPVHLVTKFQAVVDGTDGDTLLQPVVAHFLNSTFVCRGGVEKLHPHQGKTVHLDAKTTDSRMEDILQLVMDDKQPILKGDVDFQTKIVIPPGNQDVIDKLQLDGQFTIASAIFTSAKAEHRLETLSARARGITKAEQEQRPANPVASNLRGRFSLNDGLVRFSRLSFGVPGATVLLSGKYNMVSKQVDLRGKFRMQATLADTQGGVKHWLLKPLDPFFEKDGAGFEVPLIVAGTSSKPDVSVEAFHHRFDLK